RAVDLDALGRQGRVDRLPGGRRIGDEGAALAGNFLRQPEIEILQAQVEAAAVARGGDDDAVVADLDLDDGGDAVLLALGELRGLHRPRGVGEVRRRRADAPAEGLDAAAGAQGFDARGGAAGGAVEVLGHAGGEGEDGGGAGGPDPLAGLAGASALAAGAEGEKGGRRGGGEKHAGHRAVSEGWPVPEALGPRKCDGESGGAVKVRRRGGSRQ